MKKYMAGSCAVLLCCSMGVTAWASDQEKGDYHATVNGMPLTQPIYDNKDHAHMYPVRELGELLGYEVIWDKTARNATVTVGDISAVMTPNADTYTVNGEAVEMGAAAELQDGVLYAPSRIFTLYFPVAMQNVANEGVVITGLDAEGVETVTGTVKDAGNQTLVLTLADGTERSFSKEHADVNLAEGLLLGSEATVYFHTDMPQEAIKIVQPQTA